MSESKGVVGSSVAALVSVIAASSCCLPLGILAASGTLAAAGQWIQPLQPYLLGLSAVCLGWAIYRMAFAPRCERRSPVQMTIVGLAAILVTAMIVLPQQIANFLANWLTTK